MLVNLATRETRQEDLRKFEATLVYLHVELEASQHSKNPVSKITKKRKGTPDRVLHLNLVQSTGPDWEPFTSERGRHWWVVLLFWFESKPSP